MKSPRWTEITPSEYAWEREALDYIKARLPDSEPFRAWSNFEFIAEDGSINEVDLLVVSVHKVYLVEIKSWSGAISGDQSTWRREVDGKELLVDSPLLLANRKAKKLISLLKTQKALARQRRPYVEAIVFLSRVGVRCRLEGRARTGVHLCAESGRDGHPTSSKSLAATRASTRAGRRSASTDRSPGPSRAPWSRREFVPRSDNGAWPTTCCEACCSRPMRFRTGRPSTCRCRDRNGGSASTRSRGLHPRACVPTGARGGAGVPVARRHRPRRHPPRRVPHQRGAGSGPRLRARPGRRAPGPLPRTPQRRRPGPAARLDLLRQLAETLKYAHERRLYHRALTPQKVLVIDRTPNGPG